MAFPLRGVFVNRGWPETMGASTAFSASIVGLEKGGSAMAEKKVPYQVNGRPFEGVIVYDDSVTGKRPAVFMQPDWKGVCADTIGQARTAAGKDYVMLMADMFGKGYGDKPKTQQELRAGMTAVHQDLAFTLACGGAAYDALMA